MWMEESIGTKVNDERAREAISTGASRVATACPFCYIMLDDGVKAAGVEEDQVRVADLSIHLLEAIEAGERTRGRADTPLAEASVDQPSCVAPRPLQRSLPPRRPSPVGRSRCGRSLGRCRTSMWSEFCMTLVQNSDSYDLKFSKYRLGVGPRWPWYFEPRAPLPYG
jgi:hypothetical protein